MTSSTKIDWVARVREIGPALAEEARARDLDGGFVAASYDQLRRLRLFSMAVPAELGGGGASFDELCDTIREVGRYCGSAALSLSMHSHLVAAAVWKHLHGKPGEKLLRKVAADEAVLLSTGATDWIDSNGSMKKVDGGYLVSARKIFGSGGPAADIIIASARYEDGDSGPEVLHFPVPMKAEGVRSLGDWDTLGMRGTGSNTLVFDDVFVPDDAIALRRAPGRWHPAWSVVLSVAPATYMSAYVGVAEAAADEAMRAASQRRGRDHLTTTVGELQNSLHVTRLLWRDMVANAANYDFTPGLERVSRAIIGKTEVTRHARATVERAMEVAGGAAFFRRSVLERLFRDIQAAQFHPLPEKRQLEFTGRVALGLEPITGEPLESTT